MSLIILNGSPRGKQSNSSAIAGWFSESYSADEISHRFLNQTKRHGDILAEMKSGDDCLFVFPLYADGMPGQVKRFFELMYEEKTVFSGVRATFIIHSGFGETVHCRALETYLNSFAAKMNLENHGVIIIPNSEGFRLMHPSMTAKKSTVVSRLGGNFRSGQAYDPSDVNYLGAKENLSAPKRFLLKAGNLSGLTNLYWNMNLKAHKAYKQRFSAPYADRRTKITTNAYLTNSRK